MAIGDARRRIVATLDHEPRPAICQDCFDSLLRPLRMDGNIDRTGHKGRKNRDDCVGGLRQYQSDAILFSDAVLHEPHRQRRSLPEQFAERRDAIYFARTCLDYGWCIWRGRCRTPEPIREHVTFRLVTSRVGAFRLGQASPPR